MSWHDVKRDKADELFSIWIRLRDKRCTKCGQPGYGEKGITGLDASHYKSRRKEGTRFDPLNVDSLCRNCHRYFEQHKTEYSQWKIEKDGQRTVDLLTLRANTYAIKDRKSELLYWRQKLKELQD